MKIIFLLIVAAVPLSLTGCNEGQKPVSQTATPTATSTQPSTPNSTQSDNRPPLSSFERPAPQIAMRSVAVGGEWKLGDIRSCRFESDGSLDCSGVVSSTPPNTLPADFFQVFKVQLPAAVQVVQNQPYGCERVKTNWLECDVLNPQPANSEKLGKAAKYGVPVTGTGTQRVACYDAKTGAKIPDKAEKYGGFTVKCAPGQIEKPDPLGVR